MSDYTCKQTRMRSDTIHGHALMHTQDPHLSYEKIVKCHSTRTVKIRINIAVITKVKTYSISCRV